MLLTGDVSIEPWCTRAVISRPSTTRVVEMMPWWRRWGWSVRHQKRTIHIIFIGATLALCFHQKYATINQSISLLQTHNCQSSYIILQKTGLLNFTQGSYKFYVGSPAGSHLSKLVSTPAAAAQGMVALFIKWPANGLSWAVTQWAHQFITKQVYAWSDW